LALPERVVPGADGGAGVRAALAGGRRAAVGGNVGCRITEKEVQKVQQTTP
jgi:hypothetical protein